MTKHTKTPTLAEQIAALKYRYLHTCGHTKRRSLAVQIEHLEAQLADLDEPTQLELF